MMTLVGRFDQKRVGAPPTISGILIRNTYTVYGANLSGPDCERGVRLKDPPGGSVDVGRCLHCSTQVAPSTIYRFIGRCLPFRLEKTVIFMSGIKHCLVAYYTAENTKNAPQIDSPADNARPLAEV